MPPEILERIVVISNRRGLHARAAAKFVRLAESMDAEVTVCRDDLAVPGTSIMGLLMLAAGVNTRLRIVVKGPQATQALEALAGLVERCFDEE